MRSHLAAALLLVLSLPVSAQSPAAETQAIAVVALDRKEPVAYDQDIAPILLNKCVSCHSGNVTKGGLDIASYAALMKGGKKGRAVVAGKSAESLLIQLAGKTVKPFMPPKSDEPLSPQELALLKLWIDQGARPPSGTADRTSVVKAPAPGVRLVRAVVLSPNGGTVIAARANQIHVYDAKSGAHVRSLAEAQQNHAHLGIVESLALSPDGKLVASGSYQEVSLWDVRTGQVQRKLTGFADRVVSLSFSHDGRLLATGGGSPTVNGEVKVFDVSSGQLVAELAKAHSDTVFGVSFSPDGVKLATASGDFAVKVFAVPEGKLLKTFEGHSHHVLDVAWKPDGKLLASAGTDRVVKLWDYERGEQITKLGRNMSPNNEPMNLEHAKPVSRLAFLGDTWQVVACGANQPVQIWKVEETSRVSADKQETYRGHNGRVLRTLGNDRDYLHALSLSTDGALTAVGGEDGVVRLFDTAKGELLHELVPPGVEPSRSRP